MMKINDDNDEAASSVFTYKSQSIWRLQTTGITSKHVVHCWPMLNIEYQLLENATADEFDAAINSLS